MAKHKNRIDTAATPEPLTSNPFAALGPGRDEAPPSEAPAPAAPEPSSPGKEGFQVGRTRKGGWPVVLERRAKGKQVTVVRNLTGDAKGLLAILKRRCGAGGRAEDDFIEIQGDHRAAISAFLDERGGSGQ